MQITSNKKRSQEEITREADKDKVGKIALQFQTLDITSNRRHKGHKNQTKKEIVGQQKETTGELKEKKCKTDKEAPRDKIIKDVQKELERVTKVLENFDEKKEGKEYTEFSER
ncbi:10669_t:CDS:1, partial [Cetraspora pellucida]